MDQPRKEYPRPQFQRNEWMNLNGEWTYRFDFGQSGFERKWQNSRSFENTILVPFCPESILSGVTYTDYIPAMWYHRKVTISSDWKGKRIFLHCAGIDYACEIYLDGNLVAKHTGCVSPVAADLTKFVKFEEEQDLVIYVKDDPRSDIQPLGKQSRNYASRNCNYTRVTGIWQTVWLEAVSPYGLQSCRITPDYDNGAFSFQCSYYGMKRGLTLSIELLEEKSCVASCQVKATTAPCSLTLPSPREWNPDTPFLYDVILTVKDENNTVLDKVVSYAALRKVHIENNQFFLNNSPIYLRFVLDQGFYPEGVWTAPSDDALKKDILLAKEAGFNGARLHQRVFEERFHYHADTLGYLTWAEFPDWGMGFWQHFTTDPGNYFHSFRDYYAQWSAIVERDHNHPSIIAWTPFNETCKITDIEEHKRFLSDIYDLTKALDPTRPINDTSGYVHVKSDLWTAHNYASNAEELKRAMETEPVWMNFPDLEKDAYTGQPYFIDEYGGVSFLPPGRKAYAENSWGYGGGILAKEEDALQRISSLTDALLESTKVRGYCYTQLTDIEQEQNGIYYYERTAKFPMEKVYAIFSKKPSWSKW